MKITITEKTIPETPLIEVVVDIDEDVPTRYLNAIRRIQLNNEIYTKHIAADLEDVESDDPYIIPDQFMRDLDAIPVDQNIPKDLKFKLHVVNDDRVPLKIFSKDIKGLCPRWAPEIYPIGYLMPGKTLSINNISVRMSRDNARHSQTCQFFAGKNHLNNDRSEIRFTTMGTEKPRTILKNTINVMISLLSGIKEQIPKINPDPEYKGMTRIVWNLDGEDSTTIEPITWAVQELYGKQVDIKVMDYEADEKATITMNIQGSLDYKKVLSSSIDKIVDFYLDFLSQI